METINSIDSYLDLLLALPHLTPVTILSIFLLTLARIVPIMAITPFLGAKNIPMPIRVMFSLSLVAIFLPQNLFVAQREIPFEIFWIGLMCKELLIGFVIGFLASAPFFLVQMAGSLIDHSRGSSALQVNDPTTQSQTGPIGILFNYVLLALFFSLGGPFLFFNGLAEAYKLIPVDQTINPDLFRANAPYWKYISRFLSSIFKLSLQIAAPSLIGILLTDLFLGIANRLAPQVQIVFLGISLKSWVGIALLTAAWALVVSVMGKEAISWIQSLNRWIEQIGYHYGAVKT